MTHITVTSHDAPPGPVAGMSRVADHWGLAVGYGVFSFLLGLVLAIWPDRTLTVFAVLLAIQILVSGLFRLFSAIAASHVEGWIRALNGIAGAVAIIVGLLCLRDPLQTLLVIGLLIGCWLMVAGIVDLVGALVGSGTRSRLWGVVTGLITFAAGVYLTLNPKISLGALVVVACAWLFVIGTIAIVAGLSMRSEARRSQ